MFHKILTCALLAGFPAGLVAAALHLVFVQPVLLHGELYETGVLVHFGPGVSATLPDLPPLDLVRNGLSVLFFALLYVGYALLVVAGMALAAERGHPTDARRGLIWGLAGFVAIQAAPGFSLPPELPGAAAADITARQIWWWSTAGAAALALSLIAFAPSPLSLGAAAGLLLAPHLIGAPHPQGFTGTAPPGLAALFTARSLGTGLAVWSLLGALAGYLWQHETDTV